MLTKCQSHITEAFVYEKDLNLVDMISSDPSFPLFMFFHVPTIGKGKGKNDDYSLPSS
jgi:hypothetical protein